MHQTQIDPITVVTPIGPIDFSDRFRSRYHYARQDDKREWYFHDLYKDAEPGAVAGTDNVTWAAKVRSYKVVNTEIA